MKGKSHSNLRNLTEYAHEYYEKVSAVRQSQQLLLSTIQELSEGK